jgi:hypothetical protein
LPDVTAVVPHPVFELHATVPVTSWPRIPFFPPLTKLFSPLTAAVNVTDCPKVDGLPLVVTTVVEVAALMVKLPVCGLVEPL